MQTSKLLSSRFVGADVIRVLAMLMVVVLHTILNFTIRIDFFATKLWFIFEPIVVLSKASVLLFFMLSGFLVISKNRTIKDNWLKTKKKILIPLCFFTVLNFAFEFDKHNFNEALRLQFWQDQLVSLTDFASSSLWFLVVLLFLYLLNPVWQVVFSKDKNSELALYLVKATFIFSLFITFIKYPSLKDHIIFNNFTGWLGFLFFYLYGGLVRNNWINFSKKKINVALISISLLVIIAGDYYTSFAKIHSLNFIWSGYFFDYLSLPVMLMSIGLFNLLIAADFGWLTDNNLGKKVLKIIELLSGLSFGIYLIHTYVVATFTNRLGFDFDKLSINVYLYNLLNFNMVLGISIFISYIIMKIPKLRVIIGGEK